MLAAFSSIDESTSQSETTSTGATWIKRNRSALPYHPHPIRPTRFASREAPLATLPITADPPNPAPPAPSRPRRPPPAPPPDPRRPRQSGRPRLEERATLHGTLASTSDPRATL